MRWRLIAACGLAYAGALVTMMPATLADAVLRTASDGRLRISEAHGTLWSGTGRIEVRDARGHAGIGKPLVWRLQPAALLQARLAYTLVLDEGSRPFVVSLSRSRVEIENAVASLPAAALGLGLPTLAPLGLSGDLQLRIPEFSIGRGAARGSATLEWDTAGSALSPVSPLGDYALRLEGDGPAVRATLLTLRGPLQLDGRGAWTHGAKPAFVATAQMPPALHPRLAPFLRLIAVERGDGSFELRINTILTGLPGPRAKKPGAMYVRAQWSHADRDTRAVMPD